LEELRNKAATGPDNINRVCERTLQTSKGTVQAEKELEALIHEKTPQAALTELFLELKTDQTRQL